jgi:hypothetical protein
MTLLDRFRAQARDKHPDPAVRLAFVAEVPLEEREIIASMARGDDDPRVRRAAVAKLLDPTALGAVAHADGDESVRAQASSMLRDIALDAFEGLSETDSLEAVEAIADPRVLAQIARTATREIVALRALAVLARDSDVHMLGSVARHAVVDGARRQALELVRERGHRGELLAVAMNSDHKDTALGAMDSLTDRADLEHVATRGKNKSAVKRARMLIRQADDEVARLMEEARGAEASRLAELTAASAPPALAPATAPEPAVTAEDEARAAEEAAARRVRDLEEARRQDEERQRQEAARAEAARVAAERRRQMEEREAAAKEADARTRREALGRLHQLVTRVETLPAKPDLTLRAADRALHDIRAALGAIPPLPSRQDFDEVTRRLHAALEALTPKAMALREADEWQRFANVSVQEDLCARMEALDGVGDPEAIARQVRELQARWKQAADVPRAQAEALWRRFKAAHDRVWPRCEAHFAAQAQIRTENLARKTALCDQVEALADSSSWLQTAEQIKRLQQEWKTIGPVSRGAEKAIWDRFRRACDRFFTRRNEDLARRKAVWAENLAKKEALCAAAETLAESSDWEASASEFRRLQAEWKGIGPVRKNRSEAVWQRFRAAADRFFSRYAHRHDVAKAERVAAREAICAELEALAAQDAPDDLLARVRTLRGRWQQELAARGVDLDRARALDARFAAAVAAVVAHSPAPFSGTDLDPDANRKRMEGLVRKIEGLVETLAGSAAGAGDDATPATRLAAMLKEALAANTIGGKVDEESKWRAAMEQVRDAQASWSRLGPVDDTTRRALAERFQRACRRIMERAGRAGEAGRVGRAS